MTKRSLWLKWSRNPLSGKRGILLRRISDNMRLGIVRHAPAIVLRIIYIGEKRKSSDSTTFISHNSVDTVCSVVRPCNGHKCFLGSEGYKSIG